jgi:hypothetical protein
MWCCKYFGLATFWGSFRELFHVFWSGSSLMCVPSWCSSILEWQQVSENCCTKTWIAVLFFCLHLLSCRPRHGSIECHFCAQVMIYWSLSFSHNQLVQDFSICHVCLLVTNLYLGPVYVWKTYLCTMIIVTWPAIYISMWCLLMNNNGFVADILVAGQGMVHKIPWK